MASFLLCATGTASLAQETTGNIQGRLRSDRGIPVVAAQVTATGREVPSARRATSARDGVFTVLALPPGTYTVRVTAIGYSPLVIKPVQVQLGTNSGLGDLVLAPAPVALTEVTIEAPRISLDPVRTAIGGTLEAQDFASLPTGRDYKSLMTIFPHINTSYHGDPPNSAGSTGLENMYFIDGVNVTAPFVAARGITLPYNFVRSVEVRAGGYEAQYGRALGAIVNAITYSGSNEFEGSAFSFMTHSSLAATPKTQPSLRETGAYSYDVGARLSGPVVRDRLWFSAAYNPRVGRADREITGLGTHPDYSRADIFAGKLTWEPSAGSTLTFSAFGDPTLHHEVTEDSYLPGLTPLDADVMLRRREQGATTASLNGRAIIGASLLLEASVARTVGRDRTLSERERQESEVAFYDLTNGTASSGFGYVSVRELTKSFAIRATVSAGRHRVLAGADREIGQATYENIGDFIVEYAANDYLFHRDAIRSRVQNHAPALYAQETWRATDRLTLNAGLRWSGQRLVATSGRTAQRLGDEWQPRAGLSLTHGGGASRRFFGSYGRFYQQQPLRLSAVYYGSFFSKDWNYAIDPRQPGAAPIDSFDLSIFEEVFAHQVDGARAERFDEFTLGHEWLLGQDNRLTVRGIHRHLGTTFQQALDLTREPYWFLGTPGKGELRFLSPARRNYTAVEVELEGSWKGVRHRTSYVLSRAHGNFTGLYGSDLYRADPGINFGMSMDYQTHNSTGLLPNDRTHVVKHAGSYRFSRSLSGGWLATMQSGTPLNRFGVESFIPVFPKFLQPRGTAGRTPAITDVDVRLAYETRFLRERDARLVLDVVHVGNPRSAVRLDQQRYYAAHRKLPNANYLRPTAYQAPMGARLGIEFTF